MTRNVREKSVTLGEMCHIVGKNKTAARGESNLTLKDRNSYSNLILLCAHHHTIIDRDEEKYSIELLHKIKTDHELWVNESLSVKKLSPAYEIYSSIIDDLSISLQLDNWNWFIDNAVRHLVHQEFIDAADFIAERQLAIIWPESNKELEGVIKKLMKSYLVYIDQYLSNATPSSNRNFYSPDKSYKQTFQNPNYDYFAKKHNLWVRKNFLLLCMFTANLNNFAAIVRKYSSPSFYIKKGKFLVIDSLGTHLGDWGAMLSPEITVIEEELMKINKEINEFQNKYKKSKD